MGPVRGTSHERLYSETGSCSLKERRNFHKLCLFYKMKHKLTPSYLSIQVPSHVGAATIHNLRNSNDLRQLPFKTQLYGNSFLPSSVREWNHLSEDIGTAVSIQTFKQRIDPNKKNSKCFLRYSNLGRRFGQIILARCRLGCSDLNADKFNRFLIENSSCSCGHIYEDPTHFFLYCRNYVDISANSFFQTR